MTPHRPLRLLGLTLAALATVALVGCGPSAEPVAITDCHREAETAKAHRG